MKFGLVARADDRGLGIQTWEIARALRPARVLIVSMPVTQARYVRPVFSRYRELGIPVTIVPMEYMAEPDYVAPWCRGLDVIYSAETYYDWGFCDIARAEGARTVLHANPEFVPHGLQPELPAPDVWWTPTTWLHDHPNMVAARLVTMPVPIDRWPEPRKAGHGPPTFLHINGHEAMCDRNGTKTVYAAMQHMEAKATIRITTQKSKLYTPPVPKHLTYQAVVGNQPDYWRLYDDADVLVLPRRYGGLCLPANEACGAGLGLVMSRVDPNGRWPGILIDAARTTTVNTKIGSVPVYSTDARALAHTMDQLAVSRDLLLAEQEIARNWAVAHSWGACRDGWWTALADAARNTLPG